jgi:hypothetical protein
MAETETDLEHELWRQLRGIRRVVINACHGGFSLSHEAILRWHELQGIPIYHHCLPDSTVMLYYRDPTDIKNSTWSDDDIERDDPYLVRVVQEMGSDRAGGPYSMLKIVEIPESVTWEVHDYDGMEWVAEKHRTWS